MTATEKDKKSQKIQCATFLTSAAEAAMAFWETVTFEETEKDKIETLVTKYEVYCILKKMSPTKDICSTFESKTRRISGKICDSTEKIGKEL